jgi:hypothetical protein
MIEIKYLILSMENECIYTITTDPETANALAASNINTIIRPITKRSFSDYAKVNRDYFKDKIYKSDFRNRTINEIDSTLISQNWKDEREWMLLRQEALTVLEVQYQIAITPTQWFYGNNFSNEVWQEIMVCDLSNDSYTKYIEEYARIVNKSSNQVYKELKLKIEGEKFIRFRINALAERWKLKINQIKTQEDYEKLRLNLIDEFWWKSKI